jgi:hypothetical protein
MTDEELCGASTTSEQPCQNPAGEDGSCWIPSHGADADDDVENPQGRDFALDESDHEDVLDAAETGMSLRGCARAAGVSHSQLRRYLDAHPDFRSSFERARAKGESELIRGGLRDDEVDTSMAKFLLASSFDYKKTEKKEVTGEGGGPVEVEFHEEVVETPWEPDEDAG